MEEARSLGMACLAFNEELGFLKSLIMVKKSERITGWNLAKID